VADHWDADEGDGDQQLHDGGEGVHKGFPFDLHLVQVLDEDDARGLLNEVQVPF
jgi:hypothetical protein